jgi:hypothetical protein
MNNDNICMERFDIEKLNEVQGNEQYQADISNMFIA